MLRMYIVNTQTSQTDYVQSVCVSRLILEFDRTTRPKECCFVIGQKE